METLLIGLVIAGLALMAAGIFFGRKRRVPADSFTVASDDPAEDAAARAGEAMAVASGGETIDAAVPTDPRH